MNFAGIMVILEVDNFFGEPYSLHMRKVIGDHAIRRINMEYLKSEIHQRANWLMFI